jgi:hypothetical protein
MAKRVIIRLQYSDPDGKLGNRWKDGKTYLYLFPAPSDKLRAGESGRWDSDRKGDIDSVAGNEHAVYNWDIVNKQVKVLTAGWTDSRDTQVLVTLNGFNYIDRGSGSGIFNFRKSDVQITWKIEAVDA